MGNLYFETLTDLSEAQAEGGEEKDRTYLNNLIGRAYAQIYRKPGARLFDLFSFFLLEFPALIRKRVHFIIGAMLIFSFSAMIGFLCLHTDSKLLGLVVPEHLKLRIESELAHGKVGAEFPDSLKFSISSYIMFHNIEISFLAFATGLLLGAGTIYLLITNGLFLGGLASVFHSKGYALQFWALIVPHGGLEFICIFIASGAGLILGYSLLNPGPYKRRDWFFHESMDSVKMVMGAFPLFIFAALIETYITPTSIHPVLKFLFSFVVILVTLFYFLIPPSFSKYLEKLDRIEIFDSPS